MISSDRRSIAMGPLIVALGTQPEGAPRLDGGTVTITEQTEAGDIISLRRYGALVLLLRPPRCVSIGWRNGRVPNPHRWTRRLAWRGRAIFERWGAPCASTESSSPRCSPPRPIQRPRP